jgi:hypothetical protein
MFDTCIWLHGHLGAAIRFLIRISSSPMGSAESCRPNLPKPPASSIQHLSRNANPIVITHRVLHKALFRTANPATSLQGTTFRSHCPYSRVLVSPRPFFLLASALAPRNVCHTSTISSQHRTCPVRAVLKLFPAHRALSSHAFGHSTCDPRA